MTRVIQALIAAAFAAMAISATASASGGGGEVRNAGTCTGSSSSKIKVKHDDGALEVEFEVDQNKSGDTWTVRIVDNGQLAFSGSATTSGPSGSFEIEKRIRDAAGTDKITATAKNASSGENCRASASI